ncbi:MAG: cation transporter, partial [Desulfobacterales bacterium]|nr:cation transporter [Desulfobacterales bacterium]
LRGERNTWWVIALTLIMMVAEISAGMIFGSMALLADGWHMGTHAAALGITAMAYWLARRHSAIEPKIIPALISATIMIRVRAITHQVLRSPRKLTPLWQAWP